MVQDLASEVFLYIAPKENWLKEAVFLVNAVHPQGDIRP